MAKQQPKREKWLTIRMTRAEYEEVERLLHQSTCSSLSEYAREVVLGKPVILFFRNRSLDEFNMEAVQLKKELNGIRNHYHHVVSRLQSLRCGPQLDQWLLLNEQDKTLLFRQIDRIYQSLEQVKQQWSRV